MVGLRNEEIVDVHAEFTGVAGIESMFGIDESGLAAKLLGFGDDLQGERSLTAGFRAVDFDNAAAGESADTESSIDGEAAARDDVHGNKDILAAEPHDGTFTVRLLDDGDCGLEVLHFFVGHCAPQ